MIFIVTTWISRSRTSCLFEILTAANCKAFRRTCTIARREGLCALPDHPKQKSTCSPLALTFADFSTDVVQVTVITNEANTPKPLLLKVVSALIIRSERGRPTFSSRRSIVHIGSDLTFTRQSNNRKDSASSAP